MTCEFNVLKNISHLCIRHCFLCLYLVSVYFYFYRGQVSEKHRDALFIGDETEWRSGHIQDDLLHLQLLLVCVRRLVPITLVSVQIKTLFRWLRAFFSLETFLMFALFSFASFEASDLWQRILNNPDFSLCRLRVRCYTDKLLLKRWWDRLRNISWKIFVEITYFIQILCKWSELSHAWIKLYAIEVSSTSENVLPLKHLYIKLSHIIEEEKQQ